MATDASVSSIKVMNQDLVKLDRFDGTNFTRWQDKMIFLLTALKIYYVLDPDLTPIAEPKDDDSDELKTERKKRREDELLCRGHILNTLSDRLYDLYTDTQSAVEIWKALEFKFKAEEEGTKKFLISKYFDFKMLDTKPILQQVHELQVLVNKIKAVKIDIPEAFQVGAIIAKLPPSWNGYRKKLLHNSEDFSLEKIQKHLRIEEESKVRDKAESSGFSKANTVTAKGKKKYDGKQQHLGPKKEHNKFKNNNGTKGPKGGCYVCGKPGHFARDCRQNKAKKEVNVVQVDDEIIATVSEVMAVKGKVPGWWYDTCASVHVSYDKASFKTYSESTDDQEVQMGNEVRSKVVGTGTVELNFTSGKKVTLVNVLHVPEMSRNLVSGDLLGKPGIKSVYESGKLILTRNGVFVGKGYSAEGMIKLCTIDNIINKVSNSAYMIDSVSLWHSRLAHIGISTMNRLIKSKLISCNIHEFEKCEICVKSKMIKKPFKSVERKSNLLDLVHSDLCEFNGMLTRGGNRYFITFIDDCSRYTHVYLLKHKDDAFNAFKSYKAEVENQLNKTIKVLRSDRGGEYFSTEFDSFCEEHGIIHECSAPRTPQQNGLAERKNRTYQEMINCMLMHSELSFNLWGEALLSACHIMNRIPLKMTGISPYEIWKGRSPNIGYFRVWGCVAYYKNMDPKRTKLGPRGIRCAFIGYATNSKAYRLLNLESNVIVESRDVEFFENLITKNKDYETHTNEESRDIDSQEVVEIQPEPRKSKRIRKTKNLGSDEIDSQLISFYLVEGNCKNDVHKIPIILQLEDDPKTYKEAMASRDSSFWKDAIRDEMDSILSNQTWELVDLPKGSRPIGCKWVFRKKFHTDGTLNTYKARLVAKGFRQKEGIDYFDTYAPVARTTTIRVLFALASINDLAVHQMDVKTAFLNGDLDEEIYMEQPEGYILPGNEQKVCKLVKSLYGLKQAPKQWHQKFDSVIISNGFIPNSCDKCLYTKVQNDTAIFLCLYVDDMLIMSNTMDGILETKNFLKSSFKMKDLGQVDTILGIKVKRNSGGYELSQTHYIEKMLDKFKHLRFKEVNTPFDPSVKLEKNKGRAVAQLEYASAIGCLMYLMQCTRPDIAFSVGKMSRYTSNPNGEHWKAVTRIFGYLSKTKDLGLHYDRFPAILEGYTDASWISSAGDHKSTTGWIFTLAGGAISWKSKKQTCITLSTMESEFVALASAGQEAEWLRDLLLEIPLAKENVSKVLIHCDSQATLARAYSEVYNGKSRHIGLRHSLVRKMIKDGIISLTYIRTSYNLADPFTKPLARDLVKNTSRGMGLKLLE